MYVRACVCVYEESFVLHELHGRCKCQKAKRCIRISDTIVSDVVSSVADMTTVRTQRQASSAETHKAKAETFVVACTAKDSLRHSIRHCCMRGSEGEMCGGQLASRTAGRLDGLNFGTLLAVNSWYALEVLSNILLVNL